MNNYAAIIVRITNLRKHKNADRLLCTNIFGNNIIVGLETKEGDLGLYFPLEAQIGEEFAIANDLIRRKDPITGKPAGGMFDVNRRVRCQTFRDEKSQGFWIPLNPSIGNFEKKVDKFLLGTCREGVEIEQLGGYLISQKYIPKIVKTPGSGAKKAGKVARQSKIIDGQFRFHVDTAHLGRNIHKVKPSDVIVLSWKMHGTSAITSNCLVKKKLSFMERILASMNVLIEKSQYEYLYASRRRIKNEFEETAQHFYGYDLWTDIGEKHFKDRLHTGETVYYEIVGFTKDGSPIQKGFDYGCTNDPNDLYNPRIKIYVYRITQTALDGSVVELQWNQVEERVKEIGGDVQTVPLIYYGKAGLLFETLDSEDNWNEGFLERLKQSFVYDQDCQFCKTVAPVEGIVLTKQGLSIESYKLKSFRFLQLETKQLDKGEVDIETQETEDAVLS